MSSTRPSDPATRRRFENLVSNYGYVGFLALIPTLIVPLYRHLLGNAQWGDVALCLTLQGLLFSLDMALGPLALRDVARAAAQEQAAPAYARFLRIYAGMATSVCVFGFAVLAVVAHERALRGIPITTDALWAFGLALVQFAFQFSNNAAIGFWNGLERQRLANTRLAIFALMKHALALLLLVLWRANAAVYMSAFASIAAVEFLVNHRRVRSEHVGDRLSMPIATRRHDVIGYVGAALLGLATAQIDRGWLALTLAPADYGFYYLICVPMLSFFSLQMPVLRAYLPSLSTAPSPRRVALSMLKTSAVLIALPSLALAAFPETVLRVWLHDPQLAAAGAPLFPLLMLTVAMNALSGPVGLLLFVHHRNAIIASINASILIVQAGVLYWFTPRIGALAGGAAWLACGLIQLMIAPAIWRRFARSEGAAGREPG